MDDKEHELELKRLDLEKEKEITIRKKYNSYFWLAFWVIIVIGIILYELVEGL